MSLQPASTSRRHAVPSQAYTRRQQLLHPSKTLAEALPRTDTGVGL